MMGKLVFLLLWAAALMEGFMAKALPYDYSASVECLAEPLEPHYGGGIIVNPDFNAGLQGWSSFGYGIVAEGSSVATGNRYAAATNRTRPYHSVSQKVYLQNDTHYTLSAWFQVSHGVAAAVRAVVKTSDDFVHVGGVVAKPECWSMLKGGLTAAKAGHAELYFESNATVDIWVDNVSLKPFSKEEWAAHRTESTAAARRKTVRLQATDSTGNPLQGAEVSVESVRTSFPLGAATEEAAEEDGMPDVHVVALYSDPRIKGCLLKNVEVDFVAGPMTDLLDVVDEQGRGTGDENSSQDRTGDEKDSRENPSQDYNDDHLCVAPAARRRFRRASKLDMSLAAHFAGHRAFVNTLVDKASNMVMYNTRLHMQLVSEEMKPCTRNTRGWKSFTLVFFGLVFAGMLVFYLGVNYMLEEVEAFYQDMANSDFTKEKVREMAQHAAGEITPIRLLQKGVGWPWRWFGGTEEVKVVLPPRKPKRSFQEWISSLLVSFIDWIMSIFRGGDK